MPSYKMYSTKHSSHLQRHDTSYENLKKLEFKHVKYHSTQKESTINDNQVNDCEEIYPQHMFRLEL